MKPIQWNWILSFSGLDRWDFDRGSTGCSRISQRFSHPLHVLDSSQHEGELARRCSFLVVTRSLEAGPPPSGYQSTISVYSLSPLIAQVSIRYCYSLLSARKIFNLYSPQVTEDIRDSEWRLTHQTKSKMEQTRPWNLRRPRKRYLCRSNPSLISSRLCVPPPSVRLDPSFR
jgi:hypothetical protein